MTFGRKLKSLRGVRVVSQKTLAAKLKMDATYLSRIENDVPNHLPSTETIERIVKALRLSSEEREDLFVTAKKLPPEMFSKILGSAALRTMIRTF